MKGWLPGALVALLGVTAGIVWLNRSDSGSRSPTDRDPLPALPGLKLEVKEPDPDVPVLGLTQADFEGSKHAQHGEGIRAKRSPEAMEGDYRSERLFRVRLAKSMTERLIPMLGLTSQQAQQFLDAAMARGDATRAAFYTEHGGGMTTAELVAIRKRAGIEFDAVLKRILTPEQVAEFRRIEDAPEHETGGDWGFGVVFGHGDGGGRARQPLPEK